MCTACCFTIGAAAAAAALPLPLHQCRGCLQFAFPSCCRTLLLAFIVLPLCTGQRQPYLLQPTPPLGPWPLPPLPTTTPPQQQRDCGNELGNSQAALVHIRAQTARTALQATCGSNSVVRCSSMRDSQSLATKSFAAWSSERNAVVIRV